MVDFIINIILTTVIQLLVWIQKGKPLQRIWKGIILAFLASYFLTSILSLAIELLGAGIIIRRNWGDENMNWINIDTFAPLTILGLFILLFFYIGISLIYKPIEKTILKIVDANNPKKYNDSTILNNRLDKIEVRLKDIEDRINKHEL